MRDMLAAAVIRFRYLVLTLWAAVVTTALALRYRDHGDYVLLSQGGKIITGGTVVAVRGGVERHLHGALSLYDQHPVYQLGPPSLLLLGLLQKITAYHRGVTVAIIIACGVISVRAIERTALNLGYDPATTARRALAGGLIVLIGWAWIVEDMHVEDAIAIACIFGAASTIARQRSWWVPAVLLGFAVACKPWAVIALPLLLGLDRSQVKAAGLALASAALWWLPFVVAHPHTITALAQFQGGVWRGSVLYSFGFHVEPQGLRLLEFGAGGVLAVVAARRRMWMFIPLAGLAGRILFEPRFFHYYAAGPLAAALLWDLRARRNVPAWTCAVAVAQLATVGIPDRWVGFAQLGLAIAVITRLAIPVRLTSVHRDRADNPAAAERRPRTVEVVPTVR